MKIAEILKNGSTDQKILLSFVLKKDRSFLSAFSETPLTNSQLDKYNSLNARLQKKEPLAYLLGFQEFYGRKFLVNKNVLIPRAETEKLVEVVLKLAEDKKLTILDLGTGSGCIGITLTLENPKLNVILADIDPKALQVAKKNARLYKVEEKLKFVKSDLLENIDGEIDITAANLPYILNKNWERLPVNIKDHEPKLALASGNSKMTFYNLLFQQAKGKLKKGTKIIYEVDGEIFLNNL